MSESRRGAGDTDKQRPGCGRAGCGQIEGDGVQACRRAGVDWLGSRYVRAEAGVCSVGR